MAPHQLAKALAFARQQIDSFRERSHLQLDPSDPDHDSGAQVAFADLRAVEQGSVGGPEVSQQVALVVANDLAVLARDRLVGEDQVVFGALADSKTLALDDDFFAATRAV